MIKTNCPNCFQEYEVEDSATGMYVDCPACGKRFRVKAVQASAVGGVESGRPERLSMTLALVFQCIMMGGTLLQALVSQAEDSEASFALSLFFFVPAILCTIFCAMLHYRCWTAMPTGFARLTPGKAVGYLFIPCYNFYWVFPSFGGLGNDCMTLARAKGLRGHGNLGGLGMAYAVVVCVQMALGWMNGIGFLLAAAEFVLWILFYQGVTKLLNRVAAAERSGVAA